MEGKPLLVCQVPATCSHVLPPLVPTLEVDTRIGFFLFVCFFQLIVHYHLVFSEADEKFNASAIVHYTVLFLSGSLYDNSFIPEIFPMYNCICESF